MKQTRLFLRSYLTLIAIFLTGALHAQVGEPNIAWQKTIGGDADDELAVVKPTADGGYILGGYSTSGISGDKTEAYLGGGADYWVLKLDASGNIQWQNTIGGGNSDVLCSIEQLASGGYVLCGSSNSGVSGDKTDGSRGGLDIWIVQLDASGNIVNQKTIGGGGHEDKTIIRPTSDGGLIVGATSASAISGDKTVTSKGGMDYWILKLDASWNIAWQKSLGGSDDEFLTAVEITTDGGYIIGGASESPLSGDITDTSRGSADYWVVKLDISGNTQWDKTIGGDGADWLSSHRFINLPGNSPLKQTTDGGYILGGYSSSGISGDKTTAAFGSGWDYWVVKLNSSGNIQWQNSFGGNDDDRINAVEQTANGGYFIGGLSKSGISGNKTEASQGGFDYWMLILDTAGNVLSQKTIGGNGDDIMYSAKIASDGSIILGGSSASGISGDKTQDTIGGTDYWVVKVCFPTTSNISDTATGSYVSPSGNYTWITTGVYMDTIANTSGCDSAITINLTVLPTGIDEKTFDNNVAFYPNPTTGKLNIQLDGQFVDVTITVTDVQGKVFTQIQKETMKIISLDLKGASGLYFIRLINAEGTLDNSIKVQKVD